MVKPQNATSNWRLPLGRGSGEKMKQEWWSENNHPYSVFFGQWRHHWRRPGTGRPFICICLYIHCQFSGVTSPPRERMTDPPLHVPTRQHSSSDSPFTNPYKNPPANRSPAPVASVAFASPMAETRTIWKKKATFYTLLKITTRMQLILHRAHLNTSKMHFIGDINKSAECSYIALTSLPHFARHPLEPSVTTAHWQCLARNSRAASGLTFSSSLQPS